MLFHPSLTELFENPAKSVGLKVRNKKGERAGEEVESIQQMDTAHIQRRRDDNNTHVCLPTALINRNAYAEGMLFWHTTPIGSGQLSRCLATVSLVTASRYHRRSRQRFCADSSWCRRHPQDFRWSSTTTAGRSAEEGFQVGLPTTLGPVTAAAVVVDGIPNSMIALKEHSRGHFAAPSPAVDQSLSF